MIGDGENIRDKILEFLSRPIWGSPSPEWDRWKKECRELGQLVPPVCVEVLKTGESELHEPAILALRQHGYEAWAKGYGSKIAYSVKPPGEGAEEQTIRPVHPPPDPDDPGYNNHTIYGTLPKDPDDRS